LQLRTFDCLHTMFRFTLLTLLIQSHGLEPIVRDLVPESPPNAATPQKNLATPARASDSTDRQAVHDPSSTVVVMPAQQTLNTAIQETVHEGVQAPSQTAAQPVASNVAQPGTQAQAQVVTQPAMQQAASAVAIPTSPINSDVAKAQEAAVAASSAVNVAANAANAAAVAAKNAATAAATANMAAKAAATTDTSSQTNTAAADAANAAVAAANTAVNAAASANMAANMAASANSQAASAAASAASSTATLHSPVEGTPAVASHPIQLDPPSSWWASQWYMTHVTGVFAGLSFAMIIKAMCVVSNVLVQISPFPTAARWDARGCTGEADAAPYVSIAFGGCQWCFYGILAWVVTEKSGFLVLVHSNCLGAILGSYYVSTFLRNCRNEDALRTLHKYLSAVAALAALQVCALSVLPSQRALFLIGMISSFCSFINATSVLVTVPQVIRTQDSRSIPGHYVLANFCSSLVWALCGYILGDPCVMVPNVFSVSCSGLALSLKGVYKSSEDDKLMPVEDVRKKETASSRKERAIASLRMPILEHSVMMPNTAGGTFQQQAVAMEAPVFGDLEVAAADFGGTGGTL